MSNITPVVSTVVLSPTMERLKREKKVACDFQERRHEAWNEVYELNRNKVRTNRLTQRQAVNIPLMKETIKTILSQIDEVPSIDWKELGGDEQKELLYQEVWNLQSRKHKFDWVDVLDKKNVLLYGLSVKKLNISKEGVMVQVLDIFDTVFDPLTNPLDIETARFIIHKNIFRSLREILADKRYSEEGKNALKTWLTSPEGIIQSEKSKEELEKAQERLKAMGVESDEFARFSGGDVIVNLTEHFTKEWNKEKQEFEKRVVVYADDQHELLNETLVELIGVDFWPFVVWSEDPETNDIYPDGIGDLVRIPNKVLNVWFSQLVENRTLRNFQMHWYDATVQNYQPQTYEPGPGRMLPAPGDPNKTIMPVEISGLDETLSAVDFIIRMVERGTGATAIEKGVSEKNQITLGEVNMLVGKSMERAVSMAKFYRGSWYELACKWSALMDANAPATMTLSKSSRNGKMYTKKVYKSDWKSDAGYEPQVNSSSEQEEEKTKGIQKWEYILSKFPNNAPLRRIGQKRMLEIVDLTPEELGEVEEAEKQAQEMIEKQAIEQQINPEEQELAGSIEEKLGMLQTTQ